MRSNLRNWIKRVRETQEEEISCSECLDQVSQYVDLEFSTGNAAERLPQVEQHLNQCGVCHEEYQVLRKLARLELDGDMPSAEELAERLKRLPKQ